MDSFTARFLISTIRHFSAVFDTLTNFRIFALRIKNLKQ